MPLIDILGDAGRVLKAEQLQWTPEQSQQDLVKPDESMEQVITLVAMHYEKFNPSVKVFQDQRFARFKIGEDQVWLFGCRR